MNLCNDRNKLQQMFFHLLSNSARCLPLLPLPSHPYSQSSLAPRMAWMQQAVNMHFGYGLVSAQYYCSEEIEGCKWLIPLLACKSSTPNCILDTFLQVSMEHLHKNHPLKDILHAEFSQEVHLRDHMQWTTAALIG